MSYEKPLPDRDSEPHATFWSACDEGRLLIQSCPDCESVQFFPRTWCRFCGSNRIEWVETDGTGDVHTYTIVRRATELPSFADEIPYVVAYVELEEGVRICTNVVDCEPDAVESGMAVELTFDRVTDELALPKFRPRNATDR